MGDHAFALPRIAAWGVCAFIAAQVKGWSRADRSANTRISTDKAP